MFTRSRSLVFLLDVIFIAISYTLACLIRFDFVFSSQTHSHFSPIIYLVIVTKSLVFISSRLYRCLWRYASLADAVEIFKSVSIASLVTVTMVALFQQWAYLSRSIFLLDWILLLGFMMASRLSWRAYRERFILNKNVAGLRTLIVGAGDAGSMLVKEIRKQTSSQYQLVGLIDDDRDKWGMKLHNLPVLGGTTDFEKFVKSHCIEKVILAVPSAGPKVIRNLVNLCQQTGVLCKIIPGLSEIISGNVSVSHLRDVAIEDLLGRSPVVLDEQSIKNYLAGKRVLVSGAAGSIGSELCRQIARYSPAMLVLLDNAETPLYNIERELAVSFPELRIVPMLRDVRNLPRLEQCFEATLPEVVFHAAAYKHVPLVECNPCEAVLCNILGSMNMATTSQNFGVYSFVLISTDKAVNPTNVMGATKRIAEKFVQSMANWSTTKFSTVRFGNVLGSNGSVVPLFTEQIRNGGPLTITHPDVTRFFMTIPEASQLVLQSVCFGTGGEIFVLNMGESVKIVDLAKEMVRLSGLTPHRDIEFVYTGLRPGEKLYEELFFTGEDILNTTHEKIHVLAPSAQNYEDLCENLASLLTAAQINDIVSLRSMLCTIVPEYKPMQNTLPQ